MPVNQDTRERLGYMRYVNDTTDECFYCGDNQSKMYNDYIPPMDVAKNPELRALVDVPFVTVTTCHTCKSALYTNRYRFRTPEDRKLYIKSKSTRRVTSVDSIKNQLSLASMKPWQGTSVAPNGSIAIIDHDESLLHPDIVAAKRQYEVEHSAAVAQQTAARDEGPAAPAPKDAPSAPEGDVRGADPHVSVAPNAVSSAPNAMPSTVSAVPGAADVDLGF